MSDLRYQQDFNVVPPVVMVVISALTAIEQTQSARPVTLISVSQRIGVSLSYLEMIFRVLRRKEIVNSTRGPGGGYRLVPKSLEFVSVGDVMRALNWNAPDVQKSAGFADMERRIWTIFDTTTLASLRNLESVTS